MRPDEVLDANLRLLLTRAYVPLRPSSAFRARLERELAPRPRSRTWRLAAAALLLAVFGLALRLAFVSAPAQAELSLLRRDRQEWRPLSEAEAARGVEYSQGELELALAPQRPSERVWIGAHGALRLEQGAQVEVSGGSLSPRFALLSGRARFERVESGDDWAIACAGTEFALASGALAIERKDGDLLAFLESGAATYGSARELLPARRELVFRGGLLVDQPALLENNSTAGGTRTAFPTSSTPPGEPAPAAGAPALHFAGRLFGPDGTPWSGEFTLVALREERLPNVARPIARSFHDAQGAFDFPLARGGRCTLFALAAGQATLRRAGLEPAAQPAALELHLEAGVAVRGRVLDAATGAPLAGVTVVSEDDAPTQVLAFDPMELPGELSARTQTDAQGRFVLERLSSGLHTLRASLPGHAAAWSPRIDARSAPAELELVLGAGGTIEAQVDPPRAGLPLVASAIDYGFQRPCLSYAQGTTDALGHARFEHLPPGPFVVLRVDAQDTTDVSFTFVREGAICEVHLGPAPTDHALDGRLVDLQGAPATGVDLMLQAIDPRDEHWRSTRSDASGRFHFDGVRAGVYSLFAGDLGRNFVEIDRPQVGTLDVVREIVLPRGEIAGRVRVEASGSALAHAWLIVQREVAGGWRFAGKTQADEQGLWRFHDLAPGTWRVIAYAQDERLAPTPSQPLVLRQGGEPVETEIALGPGAALDVLVRDAHGEPCGGACVELRDARGELWQFSPADLTDPSGRFVIHGLPPGAWTVRITKGGRADAERKIQLDVDQEATLEIHLEPH